MISILSDQPALRCTMCFFSEYMLMNLHDSTLIYLFITAKMDIFSLPQHTRAVFSCTSAVAIPEQYETTAIRWLTVSRGFECIDPVKIAHVVYCQFLLLPVSKTYSEFQIQFCIFFFRMRFVRKESNSQWSFCQRYSMMMTIESVSGWQKEKGINLIAPIGYKLNCNTT